MANVRGCNLPDELLYDVENHTWFTEVGDGTVRIGMTTIATAMAGQRRKSGARFAPAVHAPRSNPASGSAPPSPPRAAR